MATDAKPKSSWRWPLILIGLLAGHTILIIIGAVLAMNDRTFAVPTDYYGRAVRWDQRQAALRSSAKLGWKIAINASPMVDPLGKRVVSFRLTDSHDVAIPGASLQVSYIHHAHGSDVQQLDLRSADADNAKTFSMVAPMRYAGLWEFDFMAKANGQTFIANTQQVIANGK